MGDLHGVDNAKRIASKWQRYFKDAGAEPLHWFGDVRFASFGRDGECGEEDFDGSVRKFLKVFECGLDP
jgi:hypothetical protein